jgi:hypothetical protein
MKIDLLAEAGFGKRPLLKKDYQVFGHQLTCRGIDGLIYGWRPDSARGRSSRRITRYLATSSPAEALMKIDLLVEAGFGKRPLLKKDYQVFGHQLTSRGIDED